ncbi:MAG TPA: DUF3857 domain-containing protein [Flavobacterium sp.]|jgi:hypothetical protein
MKFLFCLLLTFTTCAFSQKLEYAVLLIPKTLTEHSNSVVRYDRTNIEIASKSSLIIKRYRVVTVLNEQGLSGLNASEGRSVRSIGATVYDALGKEIKKIKRKDFKEVSVSEGSIISDEKRTYLDYTPVQYPFTMVYESETTDSNTAFLPQWFPIDEPFMALEKAEITVTAPSELGFKFKEYNFQGKNLVKKELQNGINMTVENLPSLKIEQYSPSFDKLVPYVLLGLQKFRLEGVDGDAVTWESFGQWMYNNLLTGTDGLPEETKTKIRSIVGSETDPLKKAKIVYQYMQSKTRYVSIQLGIGGWKPMLAKDVDRLGYGDCKALSNYTRSLLDVVGVPSYYAVVYGNAEKRDMNPDFVSMQGNHVILAIPHDGKLTWLECTSQTEPFGFQGEFTDDRLVLLVKPSGGEITRTNIYSSEFNKQLTEGSYKISAEGAVSGSAKIRSTGTQYAAKRHLGTQSASDIDLYYKNYFSSITNVKLKKINVSNDKDKVEFFEDVTLDAEKYCNTDNNRLIFATNLFNQNKNVPQRYRSRNNPLEIARGYYDYDEVTIDLPEGFIIEARPQDVSLQDKFGSYKIEFEMVSPHKILYKRTLQIKEGKYATEDYETFRKFRESVARNDNAKIVLIKG